MMHQRFYQPRSEHSALTGLPTRPARRMRDGMETVMATSLDGKAGQGRPRPQQIDRHVGARMRDRRVLLGLTQQQAAELVGVTYQQWHKYEKGINRVAAGRLAHIARVLGVEIAHFFDGLEDQRPFVPTAQQRRLLELTRAFVGLPRPQQEVVCNLARTLADAAAATSATDPDDAAAAA